MNVRIRQLLESIWVDALGFHRNSRYRLVSRLANRTLVSILFLSALSCDARNADPHVQLTQNESVASNLGFMDPDASVLTSGLFPDPASRNLASLVSLEDTESLKKAISIGSGVDLSEQAGTNLLYWAIKENSPQSLSVLLESGANPNGYLGDRSIVHWAAENRNAEYIVAILAAGGNPNATTRNKLGSTPLVSALLPGDYEHEHPIVQVLLSHGADPNLKTSAGVYPLLFAATSNHFNAVFQMLLFGADPDVKSNKGRDIHSIIAFKEAKLRKDSSSYLWLNRVKQHLSPSAK